MVVVTVKTFMARVGLVVSKFYKGPIGVKKVEASEDQSLVSKLHVSGFPTVLLFLDGKNNKIDEFNGQRTEKDLTQFCKKHEYK